jgi:transcriptional regulator with XRE-family HTH domain
VNVERLGRLARMLRVRQRLTQAALSARVGVGRRAVSMLECGHARRLPLGTVEAILAGLGARMDVRVMWNGPDLDRLLDAGHAALSAAVKRRLERWNWLVRVEVSYSRYGERGRIDLLAYHPATRTLLVIEIKTELVDVQALLGSLDVKVRLARHVARDLGWDVAHVIPAIVFSDRTATRSHVRRLETLFDRFSRRGRPALTWLCHPTLPAPGGLLLFVTPPARSIPPGRRVYPRRS